MGDEVLTCPKCGSDELVDWGTNRRMCKRCHEVFAVTEEGIEDREDSLKSASERAEEFLESLRAGREKAKEEYDRQEEAALVSEEEAVGIASEPSTQPEALQDATAEPEASATREFEEFYANLKSEQRRQAETHAARPQASAQKKKSSARKAIVWVVVAVLVWLVLVIICSLR
jgi:cobalamin biosynthesis Mg chelatase CobN